MPSTIQPNKRKSTLYRKEKIVAVLFILPPLIGFAIFMVGTLIFSGSLALTEFHPDGIQTRFGGIHNFRALFVGDPYSEEFTRAIVTTLVLLLSVPFSIIGGLVLAGFLNEKKIFGHKVYRFMLYLPAVSSAVALNIIWRYIFSSSFGLTAIIFGEGVYFLSGWRVRVAIIIRNVWAGLGFSMLLYLAGMKNISESYYEAADIDGAGVLTKFFKITLPMLTPVTFFLIITGIIGGMQSFAESEVFARGTPYGRTVVYFIWNWGIARPAGFGIANAAALLLAAVIMIITFVQFKFADRWVYSD